MIRAERGPATAGARGSWWLVMLLFAWALLAAVVPFVDAQSAATAKPGGTYRYGHIYWSAQGNTVEFTLEAVFKRSNPTDYFLGTAPDGFSEVGDIITLTGREQPRFYFGDDGMMNIVKLTVTAYSELEDWVMGETKITHTFETPSNGGRAWLASFRGCCRLATLANTNDAEWVIAAEVDLARASQSPRARLLPVVSVPLRPASGGSPRIVVPASDQSNRNVVEWSLAKPWEIGNAARFSRASKSFMAVPMSNFVNQGCTFVQSDNKNTVGPGCLYKLLRSDNDLTSLTVEGWVKIETPAGGGEAGGYVVSTGMLSDMPDEQAFDTNDRNDVLRNMVSTFNIKVNATHVTVGHDLDRPGPTAGSYRFATKQELHFSICSQAALCAATGGTVLGKWVHVAVQRYQRGSTVSKANWYHTYRVLVNGQILEVAKYPGGSRPNENLQEVYDAGESINIEGPRAGRTDKCPVATGAACSGTTPDLECGCLINYATKIALIFGAYKGAAGTESYFEGSMDEWRFWNGYRSPQAIVDDMMRKLRPEKNDAYGNPADPSFFVTRDKGLSRVATLMALYNFDQNLAAEDGCGLAGLTGCDLVDLMPAFPQVGDPRIPNRVWYKAFLKNVLTAPTDNTGTVFFNQGGSMSLDHGNLTLAVNAPGMYQVLVLVSMRGGAAKVPIDFIVNVVDAAYDTPLGASQLCTDTPPGATCAYAGNKFMPTLSILGRVDPTRQCSTRLLSERASPGLIDLETNRHLYPCSVSASAGFQAHFVLRGEDRQPNTFDANRLYDWRGTNVGFGIGPVPPSARFSAVHDTNPSTMDFSWTPCVGDLGMQTVCFEAVDRHIDRQTNVRAKSASSEMKCIQVNVIPDPAPRFEVGQLSSPVGPLHFTIGREGSFNLHAVDDNCLDHVTISGEDLPPGAVLHQVDLQAYEVCTRSQAHFSYTATEKYGGFDRDVCFVATDMGGSCAGMMPQTARHCVHIVVHRCVYALQMEEQLQDVAARFGMDWMRLWSLNADILHPDFLLHMGQSISVGHLLSVDSRRETPSDIAKRMGMSVQLIHDLNFGLASGQPIELGTVICVVPDSCKGMARTGLGDIVYREGNPLAQASDQQPSAFPSKQPS